MLVQQGQIPGLNKCTRLVFNSAEMLFYTTDKLYLFNKTDTLLNFMTFIKWQEKNILVLSEIHHFAITKCVNSVQPCIFFFYLVSFLKM